MTDTYSVLEVPLTEDQERLVVIAAKAENLSVEDWILKILRVALFPPSESLTTNLSK